MEKLFYDEDNKLYSTQDLKRILINIGAEDCETLFIHADVMFGRPAEGFKKKDYLQTLYEVIADLGVKNIIVPTFTYSFPNGEDYDIQNSRTSMGAFNEFVRKTPNRYRTEDPLLSVSVPITLKPLYDHVSNHSLGNGSGLDILHTMDGVRFLFLGAEMAECFTYVHYVEKTLDVPYRFDISFAGRVIYPNGEIKNRTQTIHTQCTGVKLPQKYTYFEREMEEKGYLKKERVADKYIACLSEKDAFREIKEHIHRDRFYFVEEPYTTENLIHEYTFSTVNGKITHC